nr:piggyBac transposable element-derived protein 4-like [Penaeus vannamei]
MWKLRLVADTLNDSFRMIFILGHEIAIDESLWKLLGPTTQPRGRGYISCFQVSTGRDSGDMTSSTKPVFHLMEYGGFHDKGYQFFVDNWYMSPKLFHLLQSRRTNAVGIARLNRKFMHKDLSVRRGDVDYYNSTTGLLALMLKDSNIITMLSTVHTAVMEGEKPLVVKDYNVGMKGGDVGDQMAGYYPMPRQSRVWYKVFFFLFDIAIVNTWAVHHVLGWRESQKAFRLGLIPELLGQFREGSIPFRAHTAISSTIAARRALQQRQQEGVLGIHRMLEGGELREEER